MYYIIFAYLLVIYNMKLWNYSYLKLLAIHFAFSFQYTEVYAYVRVNLPGIFNAVSLTNSVRRHNCVSEIVGTADGSMSGGYRYP